MRFRTWYAEAAVVGGVLFVTVLVTGGALVEFIGAGAVFLGFMHAEIADRGPKSC